MDGCYHVAARQLRRARNEPREEEKRQNKDDKKGKQNIVRSEP